MRKEAGAYLLGARIFIHGKKRTVMTVPILAEPIYKFKAGDSPSSIGKRIRECLESFSEGHKHPTREEFKTVNDPLLKLSGERTSKEFFTKVKWVPIITKDNIISFAPSIYRGWKDGFKNTIHSNIDMIYSSSSDEEMGIALLKAFQLSSIEF